MRYRVATDGDLDHLVDWNRQLIEDERADTPRDEAFLRDRMRDFLADGYRALIFEEAGVPVGYALFRPDEYGILLRHLFVDRARRRRGVGRCMVERLVAEIFPRSARIKLEVLVHNDRGLAFWRAVGFTDHSVALVRRT
jgi:ribosomal protein S18 acetylase RimI-like enzyme